MDNLLWIKCDIDGRGPRWRMTSKQGNKVRFADTDFEEHLEVFEKCPQAGVCSPDEYQENYLHSLEFKEKIKQYGCAYTTLCSVLQHINKGPNQVFGKQIIEHCQAEDDDCEMCPEIKDCWNKFASDLARKLTYYDYGFDVKGVHKFQIKHYDNME